MENPISCSVTRGLIGKYRTRLQVTIDSDVMASQRSSIDITLKVRENKHSVTVMSDGQKYLSSWQTCHSANCFNLLPLKLPYDFSFVIYM